MSSIITNFFEIQFSRTDPSIFVLDKKNIQSLDKKDIYQSITPDSVITFSENQYTRKLDGVNSTYVSWLFNKFLYWVTSQNDAFFDVNKFRNQFTIPGTKLHQTNEVSILRRCTWRIHFLDGKYFLVIEPKLKAYNRLSLKKLIQDHGFAKDYFKESCNRCLAFVEIDNTRKWVEAKIKEIDEEKAKIEIPNVYQGSISITLERIIPKFNKHNFDDFKSPPASIASLPKVFKQLSQKSSSKEIETVCDIVKNYIIPLFKENTFPFEIKLSDSPFIVPDKYLGQLNRSLEPKYKITRNNQSFTSDTLLKGLSKVNINEEIEEKNIVAFFTSESKEYIKDCILKLNNGITTGNFSFSLPNKFGVKLKVTRHYEVNSIEDYIDQIKSFIASSEEELKSSLVLIYLPENSIWYYRIKALLAHNGRISQVISKKNFDIYSAWNLSANLYAKFGGIPWSIEDDKNQNADLVLGLSYSSLNHKGNLRRNVGYVNVFDRRGIWRFMKSNTTFLDFDKRLAIIPSLITDSIKDYQSTEKNLKTIDIHYSKKFSKEERIGIFNKINELNPNIEDVNFVSINSNHPFKILNTNTPNHKFAKGGIMYLDNDEFLLSISGDKEINKILKVKIWSAKENVISKDHINSIASRLIFMTKINWKSVVKETNEPVTTRFSGEIAKMSNFFSLTEWKDVNNQLSNLPWFI